MPTIHNLKKLKRIADFKAGDTPRPIDGDAPTPKEAYKLGMYIIARNIKDQPGYDTVVEIEGKFYLADMYA